MLLGDSGAYMRLVLLSSLFPFVAVAQDATAIATASPTAVAIVAPECARSCVQNSQHVQSNCAETDQACLCQHSSVIQAAISSCLDASKACSDSDQHQAIAYYPQFCASFGLSSDGTAAATGADGIITAAGQAPTQAVGTGASSLVLTSTTDGSRVTETVTAKDSNHHAGTGLNVPAILGITLGIFLAVVLITALVVYTHVRRRQMRRRTRLEFLASEFGDHFAAEQDSPAIPRPPRSQSMRSHFVVQPALPEKPRNEFDFGLDLSRTSTLVSVAPPPPAKVNTDKELPDIRASAYHVEHATATEDAHAEKSVPAVQSQRTSSLRGLVGSSGKKLRTSLMGRRSTSPATKTSKISTSPPSEARDAEEDDFDDTNKI